MLDKSENKKSVIQKLITYLVKNFIHVFVVALNITVGLALMQHEDSLRGVAVYMSQYIDPNYVGLFILSAAVYGTLNLIRNRRLDTADIAMELIPFSFYNSVVFTSFFAGVVSLQGVIVSIMFQILLLYAFYQQSNQEEK